MADISKITTPDGTSLDIKDDACRLMIAPEWNNKTIYLKNSIVTYRGNLYFSNAGGSGGNPPPENNTKWTKATTAFAVRRTNELRDVIAPQYSNSSSISYTVGSYCIKDTNYDLKLYRCKEATTGGNWDSSKWDLISNISDDLKLKVNSSGDTMTGELVTSAGKVAMGSGMSNASTIEALVEDLRFTNGCAGSVYITTPYTLNGIEIPAEWYHYFYAPHRSGGYNGGIHPTQEDNTLYGCIILSDLFGNSERSYIIHFIRQGSTAYPTIKTVKKLMCDEPTTKLTQHGEGHNQTFTKRYEQLNENGSIRSYIEQSSNPDNISLCSMGVRGYWSTGTMAQNVYIAVTCNHSSNHTPGYILSHPKAFLDTSTSLGKVTSLTYATKNTTYVDSAATSYVRYVRSGHIVNVFYAFTTKGALANRWTTLFSGLPNPVDGLYINGEGDRLAVATNGVMQNVYTTSAATFSRGTFTYITDDFT